MTFLDRLTENVKIDNEWNAINWEIENCESKIANNIIIHGRNHPKEIEYEYELTKWINIRGAFIERINNR